MTFSLSCSGAPSNEGSVLVISFSGLSLEEFNDVTAETPNVDLIINESVRFTHFYTTSLLENAAMASLLTGLYPVEHGVHRNNGSQYKNDVTSLPEEMGFRGYNSFFNSGGAPVLRKGAISRGFNDFDDVFKTGSNDYLSAKDVALKTLASIDSRLDHGKFLGVAYFSDFIFFETPNKERKLQVLDEALGLLRQGLMKRKIWDGLTVVIVGLRGAGRIEGIYDDMYRVPLVIKPSRKPRDLSPSWKIDNFLSTADLGMTLYSLLGLTPATTSHLDVKSFAPAIMAKDYPLPADRPLYLESDLLAWRDWGPSLYAIKQGEWVYFPVEKKIYNTYTDRLQVNNLYGRDSAALARLEKIWQDFRNDYVQESKSKPLTQEIYTKLRLARTVFSSLTKPIERQRALDEYFSYNEKDWQVLQWDLRFLYERKDFEKIKKLIKKYKPETKAQKHHLNMWRKIVGLPFADSEPLDCERQIKILKDKAIEKNMTLALKDCKDLETQTWIRAFINFKLKKTREASALSELAKSITDKRLEQTKLSHYLWINNATLDLPVDMPPEFSVFEFIESQVPGSEFLEFTKRKPGP